MDSDDEMRMDDNEPINWPTTKGKGKGKEKATTMDVDDTETDEDRLAKAQAEKLRDLAKKVEEFVEGEGDVEGARFAE